MELRSVQHDTVREHNRLAVLEALLSRKVASRSELSRATRLSVPTVTTIGQELVALGLVDEGAVGPSGGGRPARLLRLVPSARNVLAVDLSGSRLRAARIDLTGGLFELEPGPRLAPGLEGGLTAWLRATVAEGAATGTPYAWLAVAIPGVIGRDGSSVRLAPSLGWHEFDAGDLFRRASGLRVLLENDVNALAIGELHQGVGEGYKDVVYLTITGGVGAGIVLGGQLYRGSHRAAGEVGYSLLPGLPEEGLDLGAPGPLERHLLSIVADVVVDGSLDLAAPERADAFERLAAGVRLVLHNLACVFDPELVVVAWAADPGGRLAEELARRWSLPLATSIRAGSLGPIAALHGLGQLALERLKAEVASLEQHVGSQI
ncbi:MAG: ROK family protein [Trueperaceae bacterium]|nr:ROK family protein [Trueperaceae bacterium]MCW5818381.1 ROK family protein [Trueperaceae bacterium]